MMTPTELYQLILDTPAAKTAFEAGSDPADDAATAAALNVQDIPKTDDTPRDSNWLTNTLGLADATTVLGTLQASAEPVVIAAVAKLAGDGVDLSNPILQSMLPTIGGSWTQELRDKVVGLGVWNESAAEQRGGRGYIVLADDVAAARSWSDLTLRTVNNYNAAIGAINDGTATDWAAVQAILNQ